MRVAMLCKLRNAPMIAFRRERKLSGVECARQINLSASVWYKVEALDFSNVGWGTVERIAEYVGCLPEDIVPPEARRQNYNMGERVAFADIDPARLLDAAPGRFLLPSPEDNVDSAATRETIEAAMGRLTDRERAIVTMRYGLNGQPPETLLSCGRKVGLTRERVRIIQCEALRKLENIMGQNEQ